MKVAKVELPDGFSALYDRYTRRAIEAGGNAWPKINLLSKP